MAAGRPAWTLGTGSQGWKRSRPLNPRETPRLRRPGASVGTRGRTTRDGRVGRETAAHPGRATGSGRDESKADTTRTATARGQGSPLTPSGRPRAGRLRIPDTPRRAGDPSGDGRSGWRSRTRGSRGAGRASGQAPAANVASERRRPRVGSRAPPRSTRSTGWWPSGRRPSNLVVMERHVFRRVALELSQALRRQRDPQSVAASRGGLRPRPQPSTA